MSEPTPTENEKIHEDVTASKENELSKGLLDFEFVEVLAVERQNRSFKGACLSCS